MNLRNNISIRFVVFLSVIAGVLPSCNSKPSPKVEKEIHKIEAPSIPELPAEVVFADQKIILKDEDVIERLDREVLVNAYFQSATIQQLKRANRWFPTIERILKEEGVPTDFKYLAVIESGLVQAVSPAGAQGFWQFMPGTAKEYDLVVNKEIDERLHIEKSTRAACKYLKASHSEFNDWLLAAASYNRGVGGVKQDMGWQGTKHYFDTDQNSETGRYVFRILAVKLIFENPEAYGFPIRKMKLYKPFATKSVEVKESIPNLAKWALQQGINFKILTKLNPWLKTNKLTVKNTKIEIILPSESENLKPYEAYL